MKGGGKIGVFDSGFGGLSVLRGIVDMLPEYSYVYLGDSARAPYGGKSMEEIYTFSKQAIDFLFQEGCTLVIFACNTASSDALFRIQHEYLPAHFPHHKVLGVLIPYAEEAIRQTHNKRIGVLATEATINSNKYQRELGKIDPSITIFQNAAPGLVPLIERGDVSSDTMLKLLQEYLRPLINADIDTLILG